MLKNETIRTVYVVRINNVPCMSCEQIFRIYLGEEMQVTRRVLVRMLMENNQAKEKMDYVKYENKFRNDV